MRSGWRGALCVALQLAGGTAALAGERPIGHVFLIVLENKDFAATFGSDSKAPYLARTLRERGVLLTQYFATGHASLDNYLAMISGQGASPETRNDCPVFAEFQLQRIDAAGQAIGHGCVYPATVRTLADQLEAAGLSWRAYLEDMGNDRRREAARCAHPALNGIDGTELAQRPTAAVPQGDQYATRHNPFVYFHSIIDAPSCQSAVVSLDRLTADLASAATTPNLTFITPNLCNDGHDQPCVDGQPGGLRSADAFLRKWVPQILGSPAYRHDGLLIITFDEGDARVARAPSGGLLVRFAGRHCCGQQRGPNLAPFPQSSQDSDGGEQITVRFEDFGGDRVGAVLLSPILKPGSVAHTPFNHYSLLRSLEDIFGIAEHLGYAAQPGLVPFFGCPASDIGLRQGVPAPACAPR